MIAPLKKLIKSLEAEMILHNDDPMTCPWCGRRTIVILDLSHLFEYGELHQCPQFNCRTIFIACEHVDDIKKSLSVRRPKAGK